MFVPGIAFFSFQQLDVKMSRSQSLFHVHAKYKRWVGKMLVKRSGESVRLCASEEFAQSSPICVLDEAAAFVEDLNSVLVESLSLDVNSFTYLVISDHVAVKDQGPQLVIPGSEH
jgi:hypothetical protein